MPRKLKAPPKPSLTFSTPEERAGRLIERDLCLLTGAELAAKYRGEKYGLFTNYTHVAPDILAKTHNPLFFYISAVWMDNPDGAAMLSHQHRVLADELLAFVLGQYDQYDGYLCGRPRRSLKSTFAMATMDWAAKRHWFVDKIDVAQFYVHNQLGEAISRTETVKRKNQFHPYILSYFDDVALPQGEWGNREEWNWKWRSYHGSVSDPSVRAMSISGKKAGKGVHYRWLDDCEDEESRKSEAIRTSVSDGYDQLRQLEAPAFSREAFIDTPYHIHGQTLVLKGSKRADGSERYKTSWVSALDDKGAANFPNIRKLTVEGLAKERANEVARTGNDNFFRMQYLLEAHLQHSQAMSWDWFRPITMKEYQEKYRPVAHFRGIFADTAWKGQENQGKGDYSVIAAIGVWRIGHRLERVILEQVVSNELTSDEGADQFVRLMKKWQIIHLAPQNFGEKTFESQLRVKCRAAGVYPVFIDLKGWSKNKKSGRVAALAGGAREGGVAYLEDLAHLAITKSQMEEYGPSCLHDDIPDCWADSFSPIITDQWVPVGVEPLRRQDQRDLVGPMPMATRYTGVPAVYA